MNDSSMTRQRAFLTFAARRPPLDEPLKITDVSISTASTNPHRAIVELHAAGSSIRFEVNEDFAHRICTGLDRFLTQE